MNAIPNIPYCGTSPIPDDLWLRWNLDPVLLGALALAMLCHARAVSIRAARAPEQANRRWGCFLGGWAALVLALVSPLCALSVALFSARVAQHMSLVLVAAPLLALAGGVRLGASLSPGTAAVPFASFLWLWHAPQMYALTFASDLAYWVMHVTLIASAWLLWRVVARGAAERALSRVGAAFATLLHMGLLGALITLAPRLLYAPHITTSGAWGLTPLHDQQLGGLLMWVPAGLVLIGAILGSVFAYLRRSRDPVEHRMA